MNRLLVLLAATLPLAAAAQPAQRAVPDVPTRVAALGQRLTLASDQQTRLDAVAARYAGQTDAAALWAASADLQAVLTPEQMATLATRRAGPAAERREGQRDGARRRGGARGQNRARGTAGRRDATPRGTADPRAAMRAVREEFAPRAEALRTSLRAGQLTADQFAERQRALRAEVGQRLDAARTPEQRQRSAEMRARREAAKAARTQALGLTAEQQRAAEALAAERLAVRARMAPARGAARPDAAERQQRAGTMRAERGAMRVRAQAILTPQQTATETIHAALARAGRSDGARRGRENRMRRRRN